MDKTKRAPIPQKTAEQKPAASPQPVDKNAEPTYVRGTIDPSTKK